MKKVMPFKQGKLDGLCGIYSIINAVRRIWGGKILNKRKKWDKLFLEILNYLYKYHKKSLVFMINGISIQAIAGILDDIIEPKYNITRTRPFVKRPDVKLPEFWDSMQSFMKDNPNSAILLGLGGKHDHWTVMESIEERRIYLMDSDGLKHFNRGSCTTSVRTGDRKRHQLMPTHAYFLARSA